MTNQNNEIIAKSKLWVQRVVIGCNFCPFAGKAFIENKIHFEVTQSTVPEELLKVILFEIKRLDDNKDLETTLIILPTQFKDFYDYLNFVDLAEALLKEHSFNWFYQIATFHPNYLFAGSDDDDPANYTNRSPYPMIHLLREESVSKAVDSHPDVEGIPERNIAFAREKGIEGMRKLMQEN